MRAAVVNSFNHPPAFGTYVEPLAGNGETVVRVLAAPLSPLVRSLAAGKHYSGGGTAHFVPGIDGVGLDEQGRRVYFLFPTSPFGSMAEQSLVATTSVVPVPEGVDDALAASVVTAGLSSWVALHERAAFLRGEAVLINGATGSAGGLAVQIATYLGASRIIATGRDKAKLKAMPAHVETIALDSEADAALTEAFAGRVDIVLDYLWGEPASRVLAAATRGRGSRAGEPRVRYVQIGSIAGESILISGASLRSSGVEILGSGIGSLSMQALVAGAQGLLAVLPEGRFTTPFRTMPLEAVADAWADTSDECRLVLCP